MHKPNPLFENLHLYGCLFGRTTGNPGVVVLLVLVDVHVEGVLHAPSSLE